jgi:hypothetical protein
MILPKWASENLYADEIALLAGGVDWTNPLHVLLLRLARERRNHLRAVLRLRELDPPDIQPLDPADPEDAAMLAKVWDMIAERKASCRDGKCPYELDETDNWSGFPLLRCPECKCVTFFFGALWPGARGSAHDTDGPPEGAPVAVPRELAYLRRIRALAESYVRLATGMPPDDADDARLRAMATAEMHALEALKRALEERHG